MERGWRLAAVVLVAAGSLGPGSWPTSSASIPPDSQFVAMPYSFTGLWTAPTAVWTGNAAFWFMEGPGSQGIVRYKPGEGAVTGSIPGPAGNGQQASVWTGVDLLYVASDWTNVGGISTLWRVDPETLAFTATGITLPFNYGYSEAEAVGGYVYIFGTPRCAIQQPPTCPTQGRAIVRYDPATGLTTTLPQQLPSSVYRPWTATDGTDIYIGGFGGWDDPGSLGRVVRFTPSTGTVATLTVSTGIWRPLGAVLQGTSILFFGGWDDDQTSTSEVRALDITHETLTVLPAPLPVAGSATGVYNGCSAYVLAGYGAGDPPSVARLFEFGDHYPCVVTPAMSLTPAASTCLGQVYQFVDTSTPASLVSSRAWSIDGQPQSFQGANGPTAVLGQGAHVATLRVTDPWGVERFASTPFHVETLPIQQCPPSLVAPAPRTLQPGEAMRLCPNAAAALGGTLSFTVAGLPPEASFDASTGCVSWTAWANNGPLPCILVTVLESPAGQQASACMHVRVTSFGAASRDSDGDGVPDDSDNCPSVQNPSQADADGDGLGDACPATTDGTQAISEKAPALGGATTASADTDSDHVPDSSDVCPATPDPRQEDLDRDHVGDACDADIDGDGVTNVGVAGILLDNCPLEANAEQLDRDGDGQGDACDASTSLPAAAGAAARQAQPVHAGPSPAWPYLAAIAVGAGCGAAVCWTLLRRRRVG